MLRKVLIVIATLVVNTAFVVFAVLPEFVTFAQIQPHGVVPIDLIGAADFGRAQVLSVLKARHIELFALAGVNVAIVLLALRRVEPKRGETAWPRTPCTPPNQALHLTPWPRVARPGYPRSLRSLGAGE